jgi:hypothetical protein
MPSPLGLDGQLTPWLLVRGEVRTRVEGFTGNGFSPGNDDAYWMDRFRLSATVRASRTVNFFVQAQDSRAFDKTTGGLVAPMRDTLDLRQAYGEVTATHATVRVGRQDLAFGEQRLIGNLPWTNVARSFDAGRLTLKRKGAQVDLFAASVVNISPDAFDKSGNGNILYGAYGSLTALIPKQTVEPYFLWRQSTNVAAELGGLAALHQSTTGIRLAGKVPRRPRRGCSASTPTRRATPTAPTARVAPSISSTRRATTSSACRTRSAGAISATRAPDSNSSPPGNGRRPPVTTPGGWRARPTVSTARAARSSCARPLTRPAPTSARSSMARRPMCIRRSCRSAAAWRTSFPASS